jgi:hypothetical protein
MRPEYVIRILEPKDLDAGTPGRVYDTATAKRDAIRLGKTARRHAYGCEVRILRDGVLIGYFRRHKTIGRFIYQPV